MKRTIRLQLLIGISVIILLFIIAIAGQANGQLMLSKLGDTMDYNKDQLTRLTNLSFYVRSTDDDAARYMISLTDQQKNKQLEGYQTGVKRVAEQIESLKKSSADADLAIIENFEKEWKSYHTSIDHAIELQKQGKLDQAHTAFVEITLDAAMKPIGQLHDELEQIVDDNQAEMNDKVSFTTIMTVVVSAITILAGILIALFISGKMSRTIKEVNLQLKAIAEGDADLTQTIKVRSNDEIGELANYFNLMLGNLRTMITQVGAVTVQVAASSEELNAGSDLTSKSVKQITSNIHKVAEGTSKQVAALQHNMATMAEMSQGIKQIAASTGEVSQSSSQSLTLAEEGNQAIQSAVRQMETISDSIHSLSDVIKDLETRSTEIDTIISVITEIAAQTNLLALNAAIEAARAGEHGSGFSVVANEVKKLAEQSRQSANKITELIRAIQGDTSKAMISMDESIASVRHGSKVITQAGYSFDYIQHSVNGVAYQVHEVSSAIEQMSASAEEIVNSTQYVATLSEEVASGTASISTASEEQLASVEEIAACTQTLAQMSDYLQSLVSRFKVEK